jgi:hypothetical protein
MRLLAVILALSSGVWAKPRQPSRVGAINGAVALQVNGEDADSDKRQRCREIMRDLGAKLDDKAPVKIVLTLATLHNHLKVISATRGVVYSEKMPAWTMDKLCQHALAKGNRAAGEENPQPAK